MRISLIGRLLGRLSTMLLVSLGATAQAAVDPDVVRDSLVRIFALDAKRELMNSGSGFVITPQGHILTNRHVVKDAAFIQVGLAGNEGKLWNAKPLQESSALDFALLQAIELAPSKAITLNSHTPRQSQRVYALGFPGASDNLMARLSMEPTYTEGIISKLERANSAAGTRMMIQHTAALAPGNSGGPLLNSCNEVIGTNTLIAKAYEQGPIAPGFYGAVAISEVLMRLESMQLPLVVTQTVCRSEPIWTSSAPAPVALPKQTQAEPVAPPSPAPANEVRFNIVAVLASLLAALLLILVPLIVWLVRRTAARSGQSLDHPSAQTDPAERNPQPPQPLFRDTTPTRVVGTAPVAQLQLSRPGQPSIMIELDAADFTNGHDGVVLGRDAESADVVIPDDSVSRRQLRFARDTSGFRVEDLNSSNGTLLNGRRLKPFEPHPVRHGDRLQIGDVQLSFISQPQQ